MKQSTSTKVKVHTERPDFRVFATYFFGDDAYDYDSDGNSIPVTSKHWTELYMCSRADKSLSFEIWKINENPLILEVSSEKVEITNIIAYFLARETKGEILDEENNVILQASMIENMGNFNLKERLILADKSIWRKATANTPYPH